MSSDTGEGWSFPRHVKEDLDIIRFLIYIIKLKNIALNILVKWAEEILEICEKEKQQCNTVGINTTVYTTVSVM